jgi:hypothetical protein
MPVILATQKTEIWRIEVQSQIQEIVCQTLSKKQTNKQTKKTPSQNKLVEWLNV